MANRNKSGLLTRPKPSSTKPCFTKPPSQCFLSDSFTDREFAFSIYSQHSHLHEDQTRYYQIYFGESKHSIVSRTMSQNNSLPVALTKIGISVQNALISTASGVRSNLTRFDSFIIFNFRFRHKRKKFQNIFYFENFQIFILSSKLREKHSQQI